MIVTIRKGQDVHLGRAEASALLWGLRLPPAFSSLETLRLIVSTERGP
jgi:hypothetical protein